MAFAILRLPAFTYNNGKNGLKKVQAHNSL